MAGTCTERHVESRPVGVNDVDGYLQDNDRSVPIPRVIEMLGSSYNGDNAAAGGAVAALILIPLVIGVGLAIGCGYWARSIFVSKGREASSGFCLGFFLGLLGVIIAACLSPVQNQQWQGGQSYQQGGYPPAGYGQTNAYNQPGGYVQQATSPGQWAADPYQRNQLRWYDGTTWTNHVSNNGVVSQDAPAASQPQFDVPRDSGWWNS